MHPASTSPSRTTMTATATSLLLQQPQPQNAADAATATATAAMLARALDYPYPRPAHSFLYPSTEPLSTLEEHALASDTSKTAVLAIGSNAAPTQLARKFGANGATIGVLATTAAGLDVVHAGFVCSYGALPATAVAAPGTQVECHVTMLDAGQLACMHASESGGYVVVRVKSGVVMFRDGRAFPRDVLAYVAVFAPLAGPDGRPLALAALEAQGRQLCAVGQCEAVARLRGLAVEAGVAEVGETVEEFVCRIAGCGEKRAAINAAVAKEVGAGYGEGIWTVVERL